MQCKQWWSWLAACSALLLLAACGDDDLAPDSGMRSAARDASTRPSKPFVVTPSEAVAGACIFRLTAGREHFSDCTGFDGLEACARRQCDLDNCIPLCPEYMACLQASTTPCDESCTPENDCIGCMSDVTDCIFRSTCIGTFSCADPVEGGYCDQLRECCRLQGDWTTDCGLIAETAATTSGEVSCKQILPVIEMAHPGATPCILDASTP
jgi:hypothetical protein